MARRLSRKIKRNVERDVNRKEKLKRIVDRKDCHFGIVDIKKLSSIIVSCTKFSLIIEINKKHVALFITPDSIFILDEDSILTKNTTPNALHNFIHGFSINRKLIISRLKKCTKKFIILCYKFILELYRNTSFEKIVKLLNLILLKEV